jgi:hypothetical protein
MPSSAEDAPTGLLPWNVEAAIRDVTEANCIHLSPIHIGLVTVEADEASRNPSIGTFSMAGKAVAFPPLRRK